MPDFSRHAKFHFVEANMQKQCMRKDIFSRINQVYYLDPFAHYCTIYKVIVTKPLKKIYLKNAKLVWLCLGVEKELSNKRLK
jgi:hypothetical protein